MVRQRRLRSRGTRKGGLRAVAEAAILPHDQEPPPGPILAVRVADLHEKEAVLAEGRPGVFTITHFDGYAALLVQLEAVEPKTLRDLVVDAWLACAPAALADDYLKR